MLNVPSVKLHSRCHHSGSSYDQFIRTRASLWSSRSSCHYKRSPATATAVVFCCSANSSEPDHDANMAISKSDLESCQWLEASTSSSFKDHKQNTDYWSNSPLPRTPPASSYGSCFPSPSNGSSRISALSTTLAAPWPQKAENGIEKAIFDFRFLSLMAVAGSLAGSFLCFLKGGVFIADSYAAFYTMCSRGVHTGLMVLRLVEAVDVYLTGTVMLIFGMGLYGLFISNIPNNLPPSEDRALRNSSLFGMFILQRRPKWMRIASLDELKTKLGHVVVMILLVKMFERSKAITIATSLDLLSYSFSIFLASAALLVLRNLSHH